jgi:hypothetical protein
MVPFILNLQRDGLSGVLHFPITLSLGNDTPLPVELEYWWAPGSVWAFWKRDNYTVPAGDRNKVPRTSSPQPSHYVD